MVMMSHSYHPSTEMAGVDNGTFIVPVANACHGGATAWSRKTPRAHTDGAGGAICKWNGCHLDLGSLLPAPVAGGWMGWKMFGA
mmetsp:Transcript_11299/g.24847  ORF Transcript_11299/g.24847 Transcript_11299/m.24847 type:complete len:84 (-) Transcript_11299:4-255(-)